jgi:nucleoside-diphosphate-sugar epimerase
MNVLIVGNLACLTRTLVSALSREKIRVVLAGPNARDLDIKLPGVTAYSIAPTDARFQEIMSTFKFDVVLYLATREEHLLALSPWNTRDGLDGLQKTLELSKAEGVKKFLLLSSTEIYGSEPASDEGADPHPASPNGYALKAAEQSSQYYSKQADLNVTAVRVPFLYGTQEGQGFLHQLLQECRSDNRITIPAPEDAIVDILSAEDVADFVLRALDVQGPGWQVVNLCSTRPVTLGRLAELLSAHFPGLKISFDDAGRVFTRPATMANARQYYDWLPTGDFAEDLPKLVEGMEPQVRGGISLAERLSQRFPQYPAYLKWTEVIVGAIIMMWLTELTGSYVEFRYVDFRLIYVILMGSIYGTQVGLVAALLACLSVVLGARRLGLEWTELVYNVANWLPFAVYLTAGAVTGYLQDKRENEASFHTEQNRLISEKYEFLYGVHQDIVQVKDQYYQQLVGSRDSFGRIFNITRELDTLEEEEVLFRALSSLEDVMGSQSIAIYSLNSSTNFARLEVHSSPLGEKIGRSLNLESYPELQGSVHMGEIYQNRHLLPNYPAYFAPIISGGKPVAAIAIWDARFEQGSLYYYNLFKVTCGLIQSSIHRAILFLNASQDKLCVPGTRILQPEPFKRILRIRQAMKKRKTGDYLLAMVTRAGPQKGKTDCEGMEHSLSPLIRSVDEVGLLEDGNLYVVFSQADESHAKNLNDRLLKSGLCLEPVTVPLDGFLQRISEAPMLSSAGGLEAVVQ